MAGSDRLAGGAHAYGISPTGAVHTDFCRSFIRWTGKLKVYTFFQRNAEFLGFFLYDLLHPFTIGFTHIRKTGSKFFDIGTDQWIRDSTHNLVCDEHEIARMKSGIDSA